MSGLQAATDIKSVHETALLLQTQSRAGRGKNRRKSAVVRDQNT